VQCNWPSPRLFQSPKLAKCSFSSLHPSPRACFRHASSCNTSTTGSLLRARLLLRHRNARGGLLLEAWLWISWSAPRDCCNPCGGLSSQAPALSHQPTQQGLGEHVSRNTIGAHTHTLTHTDTHVRSACLQVQTHAFFFAHKQLQAQPPSPPATPSRRSPLLR